MKNVIIFSSHLLPPSQTFIRARGESLQQFRSYYVGCRQVEGLSLPPERTLVINQGGALGKAFEGLFKLSGFSPGLYRHIQQLNPSLIHAQFGLSGVLIMPLARALNLPLLVHFRGADATIKEEYSRYTSLNHWIYFRRRESLKQEAKLFITVSKFIKQKLIEQGFPAEKISVHYHGVDISRFCPDPDVPREPVVLFVGRLAEKKGCEYLIQAIAQVQKILPDIKLIVIGDGPLRSSLELLASKMLRCYNFLGLQPPDVVRSWMNRARLLVAPSITAAQGDSEGLPNVILEAQAMGLPVVGTNHAGIPEGLIDGKTGFLVPEKNSQKLAQYILQLLKDPNLWQCFSLRGRAHMAANFDSVKQTQILEELYLEFCHKSSKS